MSGPSKVPHLSDALSALLDGELDPAADVAARQHLALCDDCAAELRFVRMARLAVRGLPAVDPPSGFADLLAGGGGRRGLLGVGPAQRRGAALAAAAVLVAVALAGNAPARESPVTPSVAQLIETHATGAAVDGDPLRQLVTAGFPVAFRP